jgi:hypothetical protein
MTDGKLGGAVESGAGKKIEGREKSKASFGVTD